jgi:hypothetical protein
MTSGKIKPTFRSNKSLLSKKKPSVELSCLLYAIFYLGLLYDKEDGDEVFLRNCGCVCRYILDDRALPDHRRENFSATVLP